MCLWNWMRCFSLFSTQRIMHGRASQGSTRLWWAVRRWIFHCGRRSPWNSLLVLGSAPRAALAYLPPTRLESQKREALGIEAGLADSGCHGQERPLQSPESVLKLLLLGGRQIEEFEPGACRAAVPDDCTRASSDLSENCRDSRT